MKKGQPLNQSASVYLLSLTEMWERYGFYCVQSLLVLYLTTTLHFDDTKAYSLYAAFTGLLYAAPIIGGYMADRFLGFQKTIIFGALLYIAGYMLLLVNTKFAFYFSLALLVAGMGYFKANVSSLLGTTYEFHDPRRSSGFSIFYCGINIGSLLGPIGGAFVAEKYGYLTGFSTSGIGMIIGLVTFLYARKYLGKHGIHPLAPSVHAKNSGRTQVFAYASTLVAALIIAFIIPHNTFLDWIIVFFAMLAVIYVVYQTVLYKAAHIRKRVIALLILFVFSTVFWGYYMLLYSVLILFAERHVDMAVMGYQIPVALTTTFISIFVITLSLPFAFLWRKIDGTPWGPSYGLKFAIGLIAQGVCFLVLILGVHFHHADYRIALFWLVLSAFFRVIGELTLSPIALAAVTDLAPKKLVGTIMGLFFLSISGGLILSNQFADIAAVPDGTSASASLAIYDHAFWAYAIASVLIGAILIGVTPFLKRLTGEKI